MDCLLTTSTEGNIACQIYQSDLAKLGVKLNIQVLETAAWLDQVNNRKYVGGYWSPASYGQLSPGRPSAAPRRGIRTTTTRASRATRTRSW